MSSRRFRFGANWRAYSRHIDEETVERAAASIRNLTGGREHRGLFLDVGCGSGLFSVAAARVGYTVRAFDYDEASVSTATKSLRSFAPPSSTWTVERGDILDDDYVSQLPQSDVVYAWGVLHHTGDLWRALENACRVVAPGGVLVVAIYNDQGLRSRIWKTVKRLYVHVWPLRPVLLAGSFVVLWWRTIARDTVRRRSPLGSWRGYDPGGRGMNAWHDLVDWVGGYPFEVASPGEVASFLSLQGFTVERSILAGRGSFGNNQFVVHRTTGGAQFSSSGGFVDGGR